MRIIEKLFIRKYSFKILFVTAVISFDEIVGEGGFEDFIL